MCPNLPRCKQIPIYVFGLATAYYIETTQNPAEIPLILRLFVKWNPSTSPDVPRYKQIPISKVGLVTAYYTEITQNPAKILLILRLFCEMEPKFKS